MGVPFRHHCDGGIRRPRPSSCQSRLHITVFPLSSTSTERLHAFPSKSHQHEGHEPQKHQNGKRNCSTDDKMHWDGFCKTERVAQHDRAGDDEGGEEQEGQDGVEAYVQETGEGRGGRGFDLFLEAAEVGGGAPGGGGWGEVGWWCHGFGDGDWSCRWVGDEGMIGSRIVS